MQGNHELRYKELLLSAGLANSYWDTNCEICAIAMYIDASLNIRSKFKGKTLTHNKP